ncbi:MAG: hypothetical protein OXC08_02960 [Thiotrichales bacterium]|nr:hypothetical protein [Thiotrichales bacterium]
MALVLAHVLAVVSALLGALFMVGVLDPRRLIAVARNLLGGTGVAGAVGVRLLLAGLLWFSAPVSLNPGAFRVLASVMLVAALSALVLGTDRLARLVDRMAGWRPVFVRLPIAVGLALCVFMLWSVSPAIGGS